MFNRILTIVLALAFVVTIFTYVNMAKAQEGLVFYLPLNEGSGTPKDRSGNPADVVIKGQLEWVDGKYGKGLKFDGDTANFVEAAHSDKLEGMPALTIMAWVMPETPDAKPRGIVSKREVSGKPGDIYNIFSYTDVKFCARVSAKGQIFSQTVLEDGKWYHVAHVFDPGGAANEKVKLYINGVLEATADLANQAVDVGGNPLWIGTLNGGYAQNWLGVLDEVSIWSKALTEAQIQGYMSRPITAFPAVQPQSKLSLTWGKIKSGTNL